MEQNQVMTFEVERFYEEGPALFYSFRYGNLSFMLHSIKLVNNDSDRIILCERGGNISSQFIFIDSSVLGKMRQQRNFTVRDYLNFMKRNKILDKYRELTDEYFKYLVRNAQVFDKSLELDLGMDNEFAYAYIMTHITVQNHFSLRLFDWEHIAQGGFREKMFTETNDNGKQNSDKQKQSRQKSPKQKSSTAQEDEDKQSIFLKFSGFEGRVLGELKQGIPKLFGITNVYAPTDYFVMPFSTKSILLLANNETREYWHISTLIIEKPSSENQELQRIFSFDTMGELGHANTAFINELGIKILSKEQIQGKSGCALYTAFAIEEFLNNAKYLENLIEESVEPNSGKVSYKLRDDIINSIKDKFTVLFKDMPKGKEVEISGKNGSVIVKGKAHGMDVVMAGVNGRLGDGIDNDNHDESPNDIGGPKADKPQEEESDQQPQKSFEKRSVQKNEEKQGEWVEEIKEQEQKESLESSPSLGCP